MTRACVRIVCVLIPLTVMAGNARAQGEGQADAFVRSFVEAINSKSLDRRKALVHPKSLVCASAEPDSAYHWMVTRQARNTVPTDYKWKIAPVAPDQPPMFADKFDYPIRPTHLLQLDFATGPSRSTTMILQVVYDAEQWHEVIACPKPETVIAGRAARQAEAGRAERVKALVANIPPPLKETVVRLFKEGRRIDAYKHYVSATGEDLATAKDVVELLAASTR